MAEESPAKAELADVTIEWLPPAERSYPKDAYRVSQDGGHSWVVTRAELWQFSQDVGELLRATEGLTA